MSTPSKAEFRTTSRDDRRTGGRSLAARVLRFVAVMIAVAALIAFGYWVYRFTLTPVRDERGWAVGNTHPGRTLRFYLDRPSIRDAVRQIGGNLVLFAPLGVLLPVAIPRLRGPLRIGLVCAMLSLAVETAQGTIISGRAFDADDVILNTVGAVLAYLLVGRRLARAAHGRS